MKPLFLLLIVAAFSIAGIFSVLASDEIQSPSIQPGDNYIDLDGNFTDPMVFTATVKANFSKNVTNVSLWTNVSGTWERNATANASFSDFSDLSHSFDVQFTLDLNLSDAFTFNWMYELVTNDSNGITNSTFSPNRTAKVEFPPDTITINSPVDNSNVSKPAFPVNITVSSVYDPDVDVTGLQCDLFANDTETNVQIFKGRFTVDNASSLNTSVFMSEHNGINFAAKCFEADQSEVYSWSSNTTFTVDRTVPVIGTRVENFTDNKANFDVVQIGWPVTEENLYQCNYWSNSTGTWLYNQTVQDLASGGVGNFTHNGESLTDGNYVAGGYCYDFAGNNATITNYTFDVDTTNPSWDLLENSSADSFAVMQINLTTDEDTNLTVFYGKTTTDLDDTSTITSFDTNHWINLTLEDMTEYYFNVTVCDRAGNCNGSDIQYTIPPQSGIYAGWNAYSIFTASEDMGLIYNQSNADFVYWWNNTGKSWVAHSGGVGTNAENPIFGGEVVWLFKSSNGTWSRSVSNSQVPWPVNISAGSNFVGSQVEYNFTNLSVSFRNESGGTLLDAHGGQNISEVNFFSYYNNSDQRYVSFFRGDAYNNQTSLRYGDAVYVGALLNLTFNVTYTAHNWT